MADGFANEYHEAGVTAGNTRARRRWIGFSFIVHGAVIVSAAAAAFVAIEVPTPTKEAPIILIDPAFEAMVQPPVKAPLLETPRLTIPQAVPALAPEALPKTAIDPGEVDPFSATLVFVDPDLQQLERLLENTKGCVAFGPPTGKPEDIPSFTSKYCVPQWQGRPLTDGHESSSRYFTVRLDKNFAFVERIRQGNRVPASDWAYAVFAKSVRTEVNLQIMIFAAARGIKTPTEVQVHFSAEAPTGFEVTHVSELAGAGMQKGAQ